MAKADRQSPQEQEAVTRWVPVEDLYPNPWNVNEMTQEQFAKAKASIERFGFIDPILVRAHPWEKGKWQIIDGEHRWRACKALNMTEALVLVGEYDDYEAKALSLILNEHGTPAASKLAGLVQEIRAAAPEGDEFELLMPFSSQRLDELVGNIKVDYDSLSKPAPAEPSTQRQPQSRWVERVFRMPAEAAEVLDEAVDKVRAAEQLEHDWQALEVMAAEAMAS